jgi:CRP-like cAMP-binding protein
MEGQKLKEKAAEAFAKGKFIKAAELYSEYCKQDPRDLQARVRMGDAWARGGKKEKAVSAYQFAAEGFAKEGFLPRAIAASKLILEIDPSHKAVQQILADLYAQRSIPPPESRSPMQQIAPATRGARSFIDGEPEDSPVELASGGSFQIQRTAADTPHQWKESNRGIELAGLTAEAASGDITAELQGNRHAVPSDSVIQPRKSSVAQAGAKRAGTEGPPAPKMPAEPTAPKSVPEQPKAPERLHTVQPQAPATPITGSSTRSAPPISDAQPDSDDLEMEVDASSAETFTELELEGDSLLHAVERAAKLGIAQRARAMGSAPTAAESTPAKAPAAAPLPRRLPKVPLFSDLSAEAFIELFEGGPMRRFKKGDRIFQQGSVGDSFYVICGGKVRVVRDEGGNRKEVAVLDEGSFFGEMAILSGSPRTATVESASDDTEVLEISATLLSQLSERHPQVAQALKKFCRQRLLANAMNHSALFQSFDAKDRRALIERFRTREVLKGAAIVSEGNRSDGLYVVLSGEVRVSKAGQALAQLHEGEIFGEMSLLTKAPATATVTATRRTSLLRLSRQDFEELIMSHPQILALVSELSDDRRRLTEAVIQNSAEASERGPVLV